MDPAFDLVPAAPAACSGVFPWLDCRRARFAADREVALRLERMAGQVVRLEVGVEIGLGPIAERVHLEPAILDLEARQVLPCDRLERLAARDPRVETLLGAPQRLDLADFAAAVRVPRPAKAILVLRGEHGGI